LGIGLVNFDSGELTAIKGLRTDEIAARLGHADHHPEVIHRDNLVVFGLDEEEEVACLLKS
jgi:glutamate 5-kinase